MTKIRLRRSLSCARAPGVEEERSHEELLKIARAHDPIFSVACHDSNRLARLYLVRARLRFRSLSLLPAHQPFFLLISPLVS